MLDTIFVFKYYSITRVIWGSDNKLLPVLFFWVYYNFMKHSDAFSRAIQTDDIRYIRSYYRFFRKPTETEFLMALVHNAHQCIEFLSPKFFRAHPYLSFDVLQIAAQSNRVDVLRHAAGLDAWNVYGPAWGLSATHCAGEAAHFLLDQWEGCVSPIVKQWKANTFPIENPIFPQREDGPFTIARLSNKHELFQRLVTICQKRDDVRNLISEHLLDTTRTHYSHCDFDAIFTQPNTDVFFNGEQLCLALLKKSITFTFPSPICVMTQQPNIQHVATDHIVELCAHFFANEFHMRDSDFVWDNARGLAEINAQVFSQCWAQFYFSHPNPTGAANDLNEKFIMYAPDAVEVLLQYAPEEFVWDSHTVVGAAVERHKLEQVVNLKTQSTFKRKM